MNIPTRILIFLASRGSKCATVDDIVDLLSRIDRNRDTKSLRHYAIKILSRLSHRGDIRRTWIIVNNRKKRFYCLRSST